MGPLDLENLTAVQVAGLLGVTDRAVRKWVKEKGLPEKEGVGVKSFVWLKVLAWYRASEVGTVGTGGTAVKKIAVSEPESVPDETYDEALARKTRAEADLKELQLAQRRGLVASIADVEKVLAASTHAVKTQIESLPSLLATQLIGMPDQLSVHRIVSTETMQLLSNLATIDAIREAATADGSDSE